MASSSGLRAIWLLLAVILVCQICLVQPILARQLMKEKSTVPADHEAHSEKPKSTHEHGGHGNGHDGSAHEHGGHGNGHDGSGWGHGNGNGHGKGRGHGDGGGGHH